MGQKTGEMHGRDHVPGGADPIRLGEFEIKIVADTTVVAVGDAALIMCVPADLDQAALITVASFVTTVSTSGLVTVQIRNLSQGPVTMLSTAVTIDVSEFTSYTAATAAVVNAANSKVKTGDLIAFDISAAGTGAKGLGAIVGFK